MTTLNDFKALRASVPAEVQTELYSLFTSDPDAARAHGELQPKGVTLTVEQVETFRQMDEEEEFVDIELDAVIAAIAGGGSGHGFRR